MRTKRVEGWGQLPREMARALAGVNLSKNEGKMVWAIVYKTIAFNKTEDRIPQRQMVQLTGIHQRNLSRTINSLIKKGIILRKGSVFGFHIDFIKRRNTSVAMYPKKYISTEEKYISSDVKNTSVAMDSRDLSKRAIQEKGLSTSFRKKKLKEYKKGLEMMKEAIKKIPRKK